MIFIMEDIMDAVGVPMRGESTPESGLQTG